MTILDVPTAQFIAYVTLTLTGLTVAFTSLVFTYRQHFGWPPIVLIAKTGMKSGTKPDLPRATFSLEFWNRRTYPLVVRSVSGEFGTLGIDENAITEKDEDGWLFYSAEKGKQFDEFVVRPGEQLCIECCPTLKKQVLEEVKADIVFNFFYFDPRRHKNDKIMVKYHYALS